MSTDPFDALLDELDGASSAKPAPVPDASIYDDRGQRRKHVRELQKLMSVFIKAGKTLRLYVDDRRHFDRFTDEFLERLEEWFDQGRESLTLEVTPASINWEGFAVFENPDQRENLAFKLYRDGVRLVQFRAGATKPELREFVDLIARETDTGQSRDLSVLFWEGDFKHIQLAVAETFIKAGEETRLLLEDLDERVASYERAFAVDRVEGAAPDYVPEARRTEDPEPLQEGVIGAGEGMPLVAEGAEELVPDLPASVFSDVAMERVYEDLHGLEDPYATFEEVGAVLAEVVLAEDDPKELEAFLQHLDDAISPLLATASIGPLNKVLRRLALLTRQAEEAAHPKARPLKRFFLGVGEPDRLSLLARAIETDWNEHRAGELFTFISLQHPQALEKLFEFLGQLHQREARRVVVDALLLLANRRAAPFLKLLDSPQGNLTADGIKALGRIDEPTNLDRILACAVRREPEVREAALTAVRSHQSPRIQDLMLASLRDEHAAVRLAALRYIAVYRVREALPIMSDRIGNPRFKELDFDERKGWYMALGSVGSRGSLQAFSREAEAYRGGADVDEQIQLLLMGIRATRAPQAHQFLNDFAKTARGELRLAAARVAGKKGTS